MDVADPVAEQFQRRKLLRLARIGERQSIKAFLIAVTTQAVALGQTSE
jgi:hypothetical protein